MRQVDRRTFATGMLSLAGVLALSACRPAPLPPLARPDLSPAQAEPRTVGQFVAAYARGDEATAESLASPLYHAEWTRRGVSVSERQSLRFGSSPLAPHTDAALRFSYVGGLVDTAGFGHFLYAVTPARGNGASGWSAWRVDADPVGQVIWAELVDMLSDDEVGPMRASDVSALLTRQPSLAALQPSRVVGIRSSHSPEGFFALQIPDRSATESGNLQLTKVSGRVLFFAVDEEGRLRPGAWSYD